MQIVKMLCIVFRVKLIVFFIGFSGSSDNSLKTKVYKQKITVVDATTTFVTLISLQLIISFRQENNL
jgi:hypothetical protein